MKTLAIDIETYSSNDLLSGGVYKYVEAPDFEVMLLAYSYNGEPVKIIDLTIKPLPMALLGALQDPCILKTAYNAQFERVCLSKKIDFQLPPEQWECTMAKAAQWGYPFRLDAVAKAMNLSTEKDAAGKALIRYFSMPCKPTKTNGGRERNLPVHDREKWEAFKKYCVQDVVVEQAIREKLSNFDNSTTEKKIWALDQKINDTGALVDLPLITNAIAISEAHTKALHTEAVEITALENPNSLSQLKTWLTAETGEEITSLTKADLPVLLEKTDGAAARIIEIRKEMGKTSVKKFQAMLNSVGSDNRVRGLLQYYGANRTGRWAGRLVQVQNLPQNKIPDLALARDVVKHNPDLLGLLYTNTPDTLSQLIRTAFVAPAGKTLLVADFSAIEARVIAWLAGEQWRLDVFKTHGKIYEASAAQMFKVPIESIAKGSELRQKGKIAELALGYQGAAGALLTMGALNMGLTEEELPKLVSLWRTANRQIVKLWGLVDDAAHEVISGNEPTVTVNGKVKFSRNSDTLFIQLPNGRKLCYLQPGRSAKGLYYHGVNQTTKKWERIDTYGGKLTENIVQAIARDLLAEAMLRLDDAGYKLILHVHDEVVIEGIDEDLKRIIEIMTEVPTWAKGLPMTADGFSTKFYKK